MRKLYAFNMVTIDGFFEGPERELDWHNVDGEFNEFAVDQLKKADTLLFGRVTYELMSGYWPTAAALNDDPTVAGMMNGFPKIVFSRSLERAKWNNTRLVKDNAAEEIRKLKTQPGKEMAILGSANLISTLLPLRLIDEYRIIINPVVLGRGNPLFKGTDDKITLKLLNTKIFKSGNVLLSYGFDDKGDNLKQIIIGNESK